MAKCRHKQLALTAFALFTAWSSILRGISAANETVSSELFAEEMESEQRNAEAIILEATGGTTNIISDWEVLDILVYDRLLAFGNVESLSVLENTFMTRKSSYPQKDIALFADWYLPIYEQYGGSKAVQNLMDVLKIQDFESEVNTTIIISPGEFVHLWSQATQSDLRDLAHKAFGWVPDYRAQFEAAREKVLLFNYTDTYPNASWYKPPQYWRMHWKDRTKYLSLVYTDKHVAFYYDDSVRRTITWPFQLVSDAWSYAKKTYKLPTTDPLLYVGLHTGTRTAFINSKKQSYFSSDYDNRLVLDIELPESLAWNEDSSIKIAGHFSYQDMVLQGVGDSCFAVTMETGHWPIEGLDPKVYEILTYDVYLGLNMTEDANRYKSAAMNSKSSSPRKYTFWFRDWFYPIYTEYGGAVVLNRLNALLYEHWPREGTDYAKDLNLGQMVHFFSGAAEADLTNMAIKAFGMGSRDILELNTARLDYPGLYTYESNRSLPLTWREHWEDHEQLLTLAYFDDHVAFYFDSAVQHNFTWLYAYVSNSWKYTVKTYGPIGQEPYLYIVLHGNDQTWFFSRRYSFIDRNFENKNVIDCGLPKGLTNYDLEINIVMNLINRIGILTVTSVKEAGSWPGYEVSDWSMRDILVYDIWLGIGWVEMAENAKKTFSEKSFNSPAVNTFWFRDWYYPIYTQYGGGMAVNSFFNVLRTNWPQKDQNYEFKLDFWMLVHFWSEAVGENLWPLATDLVGYSELNQKYYVRARTLFPFNYKETFQNVPVVIPLVKVTENWEGHTDELTLVHADTYLTVYHDSAMHPSISGLLKLLSAAWRYARSQYELHSSSNYSDPILYVVLHNGERETIVAKQAQYFADDSNERTVLDISNQNQPWSSPFIVNNLMWYLSLIILTPSKRTRFFPFRGVSKDAMAEVVGFDILSAIGRTKEAGEYLHAIIEEAKNAPQKNTLWLRNWLFPIYVKYGRAMVLKRFWLILHRDFPKTPSGISFVRELNVGEFIHFWSGAAGVNLKTFSKHTFDWTNLFEKQWEKAVQDFPGVTYQVDTSDNDDPKSLVLHESEFGHSQYLFQAYTDPNVKVYLDVAVSLSANWTFLFHSKTWRYTKAAYTEALGNARDSILNIFLHRNNNKYTECQNAVNSNTNDDRSPIIDCGSSLEDAWTKESPQNKEILLNEYAKLIQKNAKQTQENAPYSYHIVSKIIMFDAYLQLGFYKEAYGVLNNEFLANEIQSGENRFWMRDWLLPVYTTNGGVSTLSRFLSFLAKYWTPRENQEIKTMNTGQLVHFWSAAALENVFDLARVAFGRKILHRDEFDEARKEYALPHYSCYGCLFDTLEINSQSSHSIIIATSVGFTCILVAAVLIPLLIYKRQIDGLRRRIRDLTNDEVSAFFDGNENFENVEGNVSIESKPFNMTFEIPRDRLKIDFDNVLGSGEFGLVVSGSLKAAPESPTGNTVVAVKMAKPGVDVTLFKALLMELKVLCYLGKHSNIASLLAAITVNIRNREVYIVLEFCANGDLHKFIKNRRNSFIHLFEEKRLAIPRATVSEATSTSTDMNSTVKEHASLSTYIKSHVNAKSSSEHTNSPGKSKTLPTYIVLEDVAPLAPISTLDLLQWSIEIANGMAYIALQKVIHGDLAARNVLLTEDNVAKISDFGLSRQLANYSNYMKTSQTPVPWRWLAIESLRDMNFSVKSDIWAYGVTLYEIFSLATTPYAGWSWDYSFIDKLIAGHRLSFPEYKIMMDCMKSNSAERIIYTELIPRLEIVKESVINKSRSAEKKPEDDNIDNKVNQ